MKKKNADKLEPKSLHPDQLMELTNLAIEMHALYRIFDHAACGASSEAGDSRRVYRDIASLMRPLCIRLDRLQAELTSH